MTESELQRRVRSHNTIQVVTGVFLIPTSILLWIGSYWLIRVLVAFALFNFGLDAWAISDYVAIGFMFILAIEGVRYSKPLFNLKVYTESAYHDNVFSQSETGHALNLYYGNPLGCAYLVSQSLFCAPRTAVEAFKTFRSRIQTNPDTVTHAAQILRELKPLRKWVPASDYPQSGAALMLLEKLRLIWVETKTGETTIRYPPGAN